MTPEEIISRHLPEAPKLALIWTALVNIAPRVDWGPSPRGHRYVVPITGGHVIGGPGYEGLTGSVLAGGADRQLVTAEGIKSLHALYEMQTADGAVLTIDNKVKIDETVGSVPYRRSVIEVTAPDGPHAWMNHRIFVGTLEPVSPLCDAVLIRGWG